MTDIRQNEEYGNYLKTMGWIVERIEGVNYFIRKFPIIGSVLKVQRPEKIDLKTIDKLSQKHRAFQVVIEPIDESQAQTVKNAGYKLSKSPYLPPKTLELDLTKSREEILSQMKKDARLGIKKSGGIDVREVSTKNLKNFYDNWHTSVPFSRYVPSLNQLLNLGKSFSQNPALFLTSHNDVGRIIGGAIFTRSSHDIAYYWQGFTNPEGRSTLSQYSLVWKGILWAKSQNCKVFDFEGIYDSRFPNKSWIGFTHFKKSFGGNEILYPGAYIKNRLPFNI